MLKPDAPILYYGPRAAKKWQAHQYLLYPSLAYRVTAPRIRQRTLNPLQKAVAMLVRTGLWEANEIGPKLDIHDDLAFHILCELTQLGYLTPTGLSETGLQALRDDSVVSYEWVSGYVFQDPWTGKLLPRFAKDFSYCDYTMTDGQARLHLGSEGRPKDVRTAWIDFPDGGSDLPPTTEEVIHALVRDSRNSKSSGRTAFEEDDEVAIEVMESEHLEIGQITEINSVSTQVYLTTILYIPEEASANESLNRPPPEWFVCDPFGKAEMPELYQQISQCAREDSKLEASITRLLSNAGYQPGYAGMREWEDRAMEEAEKAIPEIFSASVQGFDGVFSELVAFESKYCIARDVPERLQVLPRELLKVLEAAFIWCLRTHPPGEIWKRVYYKDRHRKSKRMEWFALRYKSDYEGAYKFAADELGLSPTPRFLDTKPSHIRAVIEYNHHSKLTALITAQILYAAEVKEHPLRVTAKELPNLLELIELITTEGGKGGHFGAETLTINHCRELRNTCFQIVASLLQLPLNKTATIS